MRHVAVIGMYHSGANALAYALGVLPGAANAGESNLIRVNPQVGVCNVCREACTVLTPAFLKALRNDPGAWYAKLARQYAAEVLVSADRNIDVLKTRTLDVDVLYCFRPPLASYRSYRNANPMNAFGAAEYLWKWTEFYSAAHYEFPATGRKLWVDFSRLVQDPAANLRGLCGKLGLAFDAKALEYWKEPQHPVGSGAKPDVLYRQGMFDALRWSSRLEPEASDEDRACFAEHGPAQGMYRFMRQRTAA